MPLDHVLSLLSGVRYTVPVLIAHCYGLIYAWRCDSWMEDAPDQVASVLLVYRSPLVKDTKTLYQPVAQAVLEAHTMEVLARGVRADDNMMNGKGEYLAFMLCPEGYVRPASAPTPEEVERRFAETMEGVRL